METFNGLNFKVFEESDIDIFSPIMKLAFDEDSKMHRNGEDGGPPGYNNGDYFRQHYLDIASNSYVAYKNDVPVGGMCLFINDNLEGYLQNLFIDIAFWNQGIGQVMWNYVEKKFSYVNIWRLETAGYSRRNHNFYVNKCGFKIIHIIDPNKKNRPYPGYYVFEKNLKEKEKTDWSAFITRKRRSI